MQILRHGNELVHAPSTNVQHSRPADFGLFGCVSILQVTQSHAHTAEQSRGAEQPRREHVITNPQTQRRAALTRSRRALEPFPGYYLAAFPFATMARQQTLSQRPTNAAVFMDVFR